LIPPSLENCNKQKGGKDIFGNSKILFRIQELEEENRKLKSSV
jgi:hypothetical protein